MALASRNIGDQERLVAAEREAAAARRTPLTLSRAVRLAAPAYLLYRQLSAAQARGAFTLRHDVTHHVGVAVAGYAERVRPRARMAAALNRLNLLSTLAARESAVDDVRHLIVGTARMVVRAVDRGWITDLTCQGVACAAALLAEAREDGRHWDFSAARAEATADRIERVLRREGVYPPPAAENLLTYIPGGVK